jgi:hypothetical protein
LVAGIVLTSNSKDFCHGITIYEQANAPARP